jgi:site-specific recombinase XerD
LHFMVLSTAGNFVKTLFMDKKTFSLMFFIKRTKLLRNGNAPIYMRITVNGRRAETSIKKSIDPVDWNEQKETANNNDSAGDDINETINQIRYQIYQIRRDLIDKNQPVTALSLLDAYLKPEEEENRMILQVYQEHNDNLKLLINKGISPGTYERHVTSRKHLERFIQNTYKKTDLPIKEIDNQFIVRYETFLRTKRKCANNTTVKYIRNFGKIIRFALNNDWIRVNPFRNIRYRLEDVDKPFLGQTELQTVINKTLTVPRIAQVRDIFVFCCFTGLAFVDVKSLCLKDLETGFDGNLWIKKQRHKSKQWAHIPLLPAAKQILDRYKDNPDCKKKGVLLPVLSNQKMNAYLKEVADLCGINKNLTTHCARHTFATTVTLANKISMESVSKMLGHSSLAMTKKYARILDSTIGQEMNALAKSLQFNIN